MLSVPIHNITQPALNLASNLARSFVPSHGKVNIVPSVMNQRDRPNKPLSSVISNSYSSKTENNQGEELTAVPAPNASNSLPSLSAFITSPIVYFLSVTSSESPILSLASSRQLRRVTPFRISLSSNGAVTSSFLPSSFRFQTTNRLLPPASVYSPCSQ